MWDDVTAMDFFLLPNPCYLIASPDGQAPPKGPTLDL
jgi:hypothetical protein